MTNKSENDQAPGKVSRRAVLWGSVAAGAGIVAGASVIRNRHEAGIASGPEIKWAVNDGWKMAYRTLGRTGLKVSEVGFGGYPVDEPDVVRYAFDKGINYFDTAHCYRRGRSEEALGRGLKGIRDQCIVTTKWCPHHIGRKHTRADYLAQLDESLMRMSLDHVDIVLNHEVSKPSDGMGIERLKNPEMLEAFAEAREAGKVRFLGASGHGGDLMEIMHYAVDSGNFDVILCRYSFLDYPEQQKLIEKAHEKNVGFVAMKTLAGAKGVDLRRYREADSTFKRAALKWVLSNEKISNLVVSMSSNSHVNEYAPASNVSLTDRDRAMLHDYEEKFTREYCRYCESCHDACPEDVRIADVLRFGMYHDNYGQQNRAVEAYAALIAKDRAAKCTDCDAPCQTACDYDLPVQTLLLKTNRTLADKPFTPESDSNARGVG